MQFLIAVHRPNGHHPLEEANALRLEVDALNDEMVAAGVRVFVGGLMPTDSAKCISWQSGGDRFIERPVEPANTYLDGFWVLRCSSMEEAVAWGRKAALACRAQVEVRPFHG